MNAPCGCAVYAECRECGGCGVVDIPEVADGVNCSHCGAHGWHAVGQSAQVRAEWLLSFVLLLVLTFGAGVLLGRR